MKRLCAVLLLAGMHLMADGGQRNKVAITEYDNVLPQIADGNGWSTRIMLINMQTDSTGMPTAAPFALYFYKEDGTQWTIDMKDLGSVSYVTGTIPAGGSLFLETAGTASVASQGWAYLSTQYWVSGMAVFRADWTDPTTAKPVFAEAVVPFASKVDWDFFIPFDNRNGYVTSVALVNPTNVTAQLAIQFRGTDGTVILNDDTIQLAPGQHMAFSTTDRYGDAVSGKNGVMEVVETTTTYAAGLGLLFSPRGPFASIHSVSIDPYLQ